MPRDCQGEEIRKGRVVVGTGACVPVVEEARVQACLVQWTNSVAESVPAAKRLCRHLWDTSFWVTIFFSLTVLRMEPSACKC